MNNIVFMCGIWSILATKLPNIRPIDAAGMKQDAEWTWKIINSGVHLFPLNLSRLLKTRSFFLPWPMQ